MTEFKGHEDQHVLWPGTMAWLLRAVEGEVCQRWRLCGMLDRMKKEEWLNLQVQVGYESADVWSFELHGEGPGDRSQTTVHDRRLLVITTACRWGRRAWTHGAQGRAGPRAGCLVWCGIVILGRHSGKRTIGVEGTQGAEGGRGRTRVLMSI